MESRKPKPHYTPLKIKVTSLAAEIRLIKREEQRAICRARWVNLRLRLTDGNAYTPAQINRIMNRARVGLCMMVDNKFIPATIADVARATKPLTPDAQDSAISALTAYEGEYGSLRGHRLGVRHETRAAHLAYGFLRGVPFKAMEKFSYTAPPLDRCEYHILKFRGLESEQQVKQRFAEWVEAASDWKKPKAA